MTKTSFPQGLRAFGWAAVVLAIASAVPAADAQRFYDHDRQWRHGVRTDAGMVPDDYLRPVPVSGPASRSTPPFGYVSGARTVPQYSRSSGRTIQYVDGELQRPYSRPTGRTTNTDSVVWANGMGGIDYSQFQDKPPVQQLPNGIRIENRNGYYYYGSGTKYSGGLSEGGRGTEYTLPGRARY